MLLISVAIAIGYDSFFREKSNFNGETVIKTDLNALAEFTVNFASEAPFLYGTLAILLLAISIVSYGLTGVASAQSNVPPVSVETDFPAYGETGVITVSGHIKDSIVSEFKMPVTIKVQKQDGSLVGLDQVMIDRDGDFSTTINPCLLYTSPSPRDLSTSRMPSSA